MDLPDLWRVIETFDDKAVTDELNGCEGIPELATVLGAHREAIEDMRQIEEMICARLRLVVPRNGIDVDGVGRVSLKGGGRYAYDSPRLIQQWAARISDEVVDRETGEVPPVGAIVEQAVQTFATAVGASAPSFAGWRMGVAEEHGVDLAEHREWVHTGEPRVVIDTGGG